MTTCARCGHELGIGRFCLNCGHPVGEPVPPGVEPSRASPDVAALPDQPSPVPPWATWALGGVLVLTLFVVLASCLGDGDEPASSPDATAWRTVGDASGETITFTLREPATIRRVGLINGYAKQVPSGRGLVDWYPNNRRITAVERVFDDGTAVRQDLAEKSKLQRLTVDPVTTSTVQLRLLVVTPPGAGVLGRDYTAISDVLIAGTPAA